VAGRSPRQSLEPEPEGAQPEPEPEPAAPAQPAQSLKAFLAPGHSVPAAAEGDVADYTRSAGRHPRSFLVPTGSRLMALMGCLRSESETDDDDYHDFETPRDLAPDSPPPPAAHAKSPPATVGATTVIHPPLPAHGTGRGAGASGITAKSAGAGAVASEAGAEEPTPEGPGGGGAESAMAVAGGPGTASMGRRVIQAPLRIFHE
jgi:hypothetical protein